MTVAVTISSVTDPVSATNEASVTATGTTDVSTNTVSVKITDTANGSVTASATVTGTNWTLPTTDVSTLADGTLIYEATATSLTATQAFAAKAASKLTAAPAYVTLSQFRDYIKDPGSNNPDTMTQAILTASRAVEQTCDREHFYQVGPEARYFWPDSTAECPIDDLATTSGLTVVVDIAGDGTYSQPWTINTDYFLEPVNQPIGWPLNRLSATFAQKFFPLRQTFLYMRPTVRVTGTWGWPVIPAAVIQATLVGAAQLYKLGEAPFGATYGEWGVMRVRANPIVQELLQPYARDAGITVA